MSVKWVPCFTNKIQTNELCLERSRMHPFLFQLTDSVAEVSDLSVKDFILPNLVDDVKPRLKSPLSGVFPSAHKEPAIKFCAEDPSVMVRVN